MPDYEEWERTVPDAITRDVLWRIEAYRLALFAAELAWQDVSRLWRDPRMRALGDQLHRALCSISANIAEGYSRSTGRDRAHFYEYALGSAREGRDWYYKARHTLGEETTTQRLALLTQIIRLLLRMVPEQRGHSLCEPASAYHTGDEPVPSSPDT
ncbi:MAG: four helix bundle protein [Anaerolineae bacterium]|nr:four helix bundle protein [Anaerolineae bacterium]